MTKAVRFFTIGEAAERCDIPASTLRFYEKKGLIRSIRTEGNQRRYHQSMLRQVSVIKAAQTLGISLEEIEQVFSSLPDKRAPNKRDWENMSSKWAAQLDEKIIAMQRLRQNLTGCIGCGCLSLKVCGLFNPDDQVAERGKGPRYLIEGRPDEQ